MKRVKIFLAFILLAFNHTYGQSINNLNGYKYFYVPPISYEDGATDKFGIRAEVLKKFNALGLKVLDDLSSPEIDPCSISICLIKHTGYYYQPTANELVLKIINCNSQEIYSDSYITGSYVISFSTVFKKGIKEILSKFNKLNYSYDESLSFKFPAVEKVDETENSLKAYFDANKLDMIEGIYKAYQSESMGYYKFAIKKRDNKFIAIILEAENKTWKPAEVKAIFEPSSMNGFFSVKWFMGNKEPIETFAAIENEGLLSVELKGEANIKSQAKFIKMYPGSENSNSSLKKVVGSSGSGFFVSTNGLIATNAHVVNDAKTIKVDVANETGNSSYSAKIVLIDKKNDVALIQIDDQKFKSLNTLPYGISEKGDIGEKTFTIGYPLNDIMGTNYKLTDGIISAKSGISDDVRYYQITVPLQPGNSGGPLFNNQGNIIGITSSKLNGNTVGVNIENVNYAIKATYLISLMNMLPNSNIPTGLNKLATKELKDQVKVLKNYVCLIHIVQ